MAVLAALWLGITVGFAVYRGAECYIWNDTPSVMTPSPVANASGQHHPGWSGAVGTTESLRNFAASEPLRYIVVELHNAFVRSRSGGYRPISHLQSQIAILLFEREGPSLLHRLLWGACYGSAGVCLFLVARRFTKTDIAALLAIVLFYATPPAVTASWVVVAGLQILVPLCLCAGLLCYWHSMEGTRGRNAAFGVVVLLLLIGPWIREFLGVLPLLLGLLELVRYRRLTWRHAVFSAAFLHAVFPTAIPKLIAFPDLPLVPVHRLGHLGEQVSEARPIRWYACWHFVPLLPPTLWLLTSAASATLGVHLAWTKWFGGAAVADRLWNTWSRQPRSRKAIDAFQTAFSIAPAAWLLLVQTMHERGAPWTQVAFAVCWMVVVMAMHVHWFLAVWFAVTFLPLLWVFAEHVHFLYCLAPTCIVFAAVLERAWLVLQLEAESASTAFRSRAIRVGQLVLAVLVLALVVDHCLTLPNARRVMIAQARSVQSISDRVMETIPPNSIVLCNVVHGAEIGWANDSSIEVRPTITAGVFNPEQAVATREAFDELWANRGDRRLFLLDCTFDRLAHKRAYHGHLFVNVFNVPKKSLGEVFTHRTSYRHLDPLRRLVAREFVPFLGPPDLVDDYYTGPSYTGPSQSGAAHTWDVAATYELHEVTGPVQSPRAIPESPVELVEANVHGFNIVRQGAGVFAIPACDGPFVADDFNAGKYTAQFAGFSVDEVRNQVADFAKSSPLMEQILARPPEVVREGLHGFNIIRFGDRYFGVDQESGPFDDRGVRTGARTDYLVGATADEVAASVEHLAASNPEIIRRDRVPRLIERNYLRYNIVAFEGMIYGLAQTEGSFDIEAFRAGKYSKCVSGTTLREVKDQIETLQYGSGSSNATK
jgi:hypothetical protein